MEKQIIISISREYGSGGREIGEKLANKLEMEFYDRKLLESIYNVNNIKDKQKVCLKNIF